MNPMLLIVQNKLFLKKVKKYTFFLNCLKISSTIWTAMLVKVQNQFDIKLAHEILEYDHFKMVRVIIGGKYYG